MTLLIDESRSVLPLWSAEAREFGELRGGWGGGGVASARVPDLNSGQNQSFLARPEWKMESDQRPSLPSLPEFTDPHVTTCDIEVQCTCLRVRHIWPRPLLTLL